MDNLPIDYSREAFTCRIIRRRGKALLMVFPGKEPFWVEPGDILAFGRYASVYRPGQTINGKFVALNEVSFLKRAREDVKGMSKDYKSEFMADLEEQYGDWVRERSLVQYAVAVFFIWLGCFTLGRFVAGAPHANLLIFYLLVNVSVCLLLSAFLAYILSENARYVKLKVKGRRERLKLFFRHFCLNFVSRERSLKEIWAFLPRNDGSTGGGGSEDTALRSTGAEALSLAAWAAWALFAVFSAMAVVSAAAILNKGDRKSQKRKISKDEVIREATALWGDHYAQTGIFFSYTYVVRELGIDRIDYLSVVSR